MTERIPPFFQHLLRDCRGQDLVEYSLLLGFVAVAGAATFPPIAEPIAEIFSKMQSITNTAGGI